MKRILFLVFLALTPGVRADFGISLEELEYWERREQRKDPDIRTVRTQAEISDMIEEVYIGHRIAVGKFRVVVPDQKGEPRDPK